MITTRSKFIYGTTVDSSNANGDFQEGATVYLATLLSSAYTLAELVTAVQTALNTVGGQTYTVSLSRSTGLVTISAASTFRLLLGTGANLGQAFWTVLGFTQGIDLTGATTYTGASRAGTTYTPQFFLQSYVSPDDYREAIQPTVNRTMTGRTELVRFGVDQFIDMDIQYITDSQMDGAVIRNNPSGVANARSFMQDITSKSRFEFVPDVGTPGTVYKCICEMTPGFKDGSGYKLKERFADGLPGVFETGVITLRVVS